MLEIQAIEDSQQLERFEYLNEQILLNILPIHIAYNYALRSDPYSHLCHSVGVVTIRFDIAGGWQGEFGFDRLNRIVFEVDQMVERFIGVEKVALYQNQTLRNNT